MLTAAAWIGRRADAAAEESPSFVSFPGVPIVDAHQHSLYAGRPDKNLLLHQRNTGIRTTILLPASNPGGPQSPVAGNDYVADFVRAQGGGFVFFASANAAAADNAVVLEKYLKQGALGIGELKDQVECDSPGIIRSAEVAREFGVPMVLHFQETDPKGGIGFNRGYARFHRVIEKFPTVNFIGHAQTFWANVDRHYRPELGLSPHGPVAAGGLTDRWLAAYPNFYGDLSANSGNNALARDSAFAADFLTRHQDKLIYGSDCSCATGVGPACIAAVKQRFLKQLCRTDEVRDKLLYGNIRRLVRLGARATV
jgi:predicted TIM-barrel fold metal-dependent hydrolase